MPDGARRRRRGLARHCSGDVDEEFAPTRRLAAPGVAGRRGRRRRGDRHRHRVDRAGHARQRRPPPAAATRPAAPPAAAESRNVRVRADRRRGRDRGGRRHGRELGAARRACWRRGGSCSTSAAPGRRPCRRRSRRPTPTAAAAVADTLGVRVDGAWRLSSKGLAKLVDSVGGVRVDTEVKVGAPTASSCRAAARRTGCDGDGGGASSPTRTPRGPAEAQKLARFYAVLDGVLLALPDDARAAGGQAGRAWAPRRSRRCRTTSCTALRR